MAQRTGGSVRNARTLIEDVELARRLEARTFRDALDSVPRYRA